MVQVIRALRIDPKTEQPLSEPVYAAQIDKAKEEIRRHKALDPDAAIDETLTKANYVCMDPKCRTGLIPHKSYLSEHYSQSSGEAFRVASAAHFQRAPHAPFHDKDCQEVSFATYTDNARQAGGMALREGGFLFNLNIKTGVHAPLRLGNGAAQVLGREFRAHTAPLKTPRQLSRGISDVGALIKILDDTEFDKDLRQQILLRIGEKKYTLDDLYKKSLAEYFFKEKDLAVEGKTSPPALIHFKPIASPEFHRVRDRTIQGQAVQVQRESGLRHTVSVMVHCADRAMFDHVTGAIQSGARSFALYVERTGIDIPQIRQTTKDIMFGNKTDSAMFLHVTLASADQIRLWTPQSPQLSLLPTAPSPGHGRDANPPGPLFG
jgi:hypothetical protein